MEGDNYAGGWGKRVADIKELGDAEAFRKIESVIPIFIETGDPLPDSEIQAAIDERKQKKLHQRKINEVRRAEEQLERAKAALYT